VKQGKARALQVGVRLCSGLELDLFEQNYGQPNWDQSHPHIAFNVPTESLPKWAAHLKKWGVPIAGPMTRAGSGAAEIYFNDPDGNHLELYCSSYPDHATLPSGPFDKKSVVHEKPWPAPALEAYARAQDEKERLRCPVMLQRHQSSRGAKTFGQPGRRTEHLSLRP
jgi:hypothetical protein